MPLDMFVELIGFVGDRVDQQAINKLRWQERRIPVVDCTTLAMPDTAENQKVFPPAECVESYIRVHYLPAGITCLFNGVL